MADFLIAGDMHDPDWIAEQDQSNASVEPLENRFVTFAGLELQQLRNFIVTVSQEAFCYFCSQW